ncbi:MAG: DUF3821 domain-containing protein [Methanomicrobiales archaeon]|nr:DUF3821 domain-containing protein [Methanomicrobiales archaeon]
MGVILLVVACTAPAAARGPAIGDIAAGDTIFWYEEGLNLTGLRDSVTNNPLTALRRYSGDDPSKAVLSELPISDDTSFDVPSVLIDTSPAVYYGYTPADGATVSVIVWKPELSLGVTLANPWHADAVEGLSLPEGTAIAFKITSPYVGTSYRVGSTYAARVDLVFTTPGGGELTALQGKDFSGMLVDTPVFYTDDPGKPGSIVLSGLEKGTYTVQARWNAPRSFADEAEDSNEVAFSYGQGSEPTITVQPTATPATPSPAPTTVPATTVPPTPVPATTSPPETTVPPTSPASPTPTQAGTGAMGAVMAAAALLLIASKKS